MIITKLDKGSRVVVMDKSEYTRLLCEASINVQKKILESWPAETKQER